MHAQHLENSPVAGLARLNCYYVKASQPACLASPAGVKRAGPVTGLARFHVIVPFAFVMFTLFGVPALLHVIRALTFYALSNGLRDRAPH